MLRLAPGAPEVIETVQNGRVYKDGDVIGDQDQTGIGRRRRLSWTGHVVMALVVDRNGDLLADPEIVCEGLPRMADEEDSFEDVLYDAGLSAFENIPRKKRRDDMPVSSRRSSALSGRKFARSGARSPLSRFSSPGSRAMIGRLNHVAIAVPDLEAGTALYRDTLGASVSAPTGAAGAWGHRRFRRTAQHQDRTARAAW